MKLRRIYLLLVLPFFVLTNTPHNANAQVGKVFNKLKKKPKQKKIKKLDTVKKSKPNGKVMLKASKKKSGSGGKKNRKGKRNKREERTRQNNSKAPSKGKPLLDNSVIPKFPESKKREIMQKHWFNNTKGKSRFMKGITWSELEKKIRTTVKKGKPITDKEYPTRTIFIHEFDKVIGTGKNGDARKHLKVVLESDGSIVTTYPFRYIKK